MYLSTILNFFYYLLYGTALGSVGFTSTILLISIINEFSNFNTNNNNIEQEIDDFNNKALDELEELEEIELSDEAIEELKEKEFYCETPYCTILMKYDPIFNGFIYYSDLSVLYNTLNSVARQFVVKYNCKKLFKYEKQDVTSEEEEVFDDEYHQVETINVSSIPKYSIFQILKILWNKEEDEPQGGGGGGGSEEEGSEEEGSKEEEPSVFANFKNYKLKNENNSESGEIFEEKEINNFKYKGKLDDYLNEKSKQTEKETNESDISYIDYKKSKTQ